jgi:hypothetical protein
MGPLYKPLSMPIAPVQMMVGAAAAGGAIAGAAMALRNRAAKKAAQVAHQKMTVDDLEKAK